MGIVFILISGAAFGLLPWFARTAYDHGAEPLGMLAVRFSIASIILLLAHVFRSEKTTLPQRTLGIQLFLLGAVGGIRSVCHGSSEWGSREKNGTGK